MALPGEKEILTILNVKNLNLCRYDEVIDIHIEKTYDDISSTKTYNGCDWELSYKQFKRLNENTIRGIKNVYIKKSICTFSH